MAFDAGMVAAVAAELRNRLMGGRVDKISQPEKDEITLAIRVADGSYARLCISAGNNNPHINITSQQKENPMTAPMFCMLLRKHLSGARVSDIFQRGFERVIELRFETRDEMGFLCERSIIAEIMGKYSNIIFCSGETARTGTLLPVPEFHSSSAVLKILTDNKELQKDAVSCRQSQIKNSVKICTPLWLIKLFML